MLTLAKRLSTPALHHPDLGLLILRATLSVLILGHGIKKAIDGTAFIESTLQSHGLPAFLAHGVHIGEIVAPLAIIIGFRTRLFSSIFAFNMLVAILLVWNQKLASFNQYGGWEPELPAMFMLGAVALMFTGAGKIAVSSRHPLD